MIFYFVSELREPSWIWDASRSAIDLCQLNGEFYSEAGYNPCSDAISRSPYVFDIDRAAQCGLL